MQCENVAKIKEHPQLSLAKNLLVSPPARRRWWVCAYRTANVVVLIFIFVYS